jgi:hypothetical protein
MAIVARLLDGRFMARDTSDEITVPVAGGAQAVTVTMKDLKQVEYVVQVNVTTDPVVDVSVPQNIKIDKNVVGLTLYCGAGTTLTVEAICTGF